MQQMRKAPRIESESGAPVFFERIRILFAL